VPTLIRSLRTKLLVIVALIAVIIIGWLIFAKDQPGTTSSGDLPNTPSASLDGLVYVVRQSATKTVEPHLLNLSTSSASTISPTPLGPFSDAFPQSADIKGQKVLFTVDNQLFLSQDGGRTYSHVYGDAGSGNVIVSAKLSQDATRIALSEYMPGVDGNSVKAMDLTGQNQTQLFTTPSSGTAIIGWNDDSVVYRLDYASCDSAPLVCGRYDTNGIVKHNLATGADDAVVPANKYIMYSSDMKVSDDMTHLAFVGGAIKKIPQSNGETGYTSKAPYAVIDYNLSTMKSSTLATIQPQPGDDKKPVDHYVTAGFFYKSNQVYYSADKNIYAASNTTHPLYSADSIVRRLLLADNTQLIFTQEDETNGSNTYARIYNLQTKDSRKLLDQTTMVNQTSMLISSVTTK